MTARSTALEQGDHERGLYILYVFISPSSSTTSFFLLFVLSRHCVEETRLIQLSRQIRSRTLAISFEASALLQLVGTLVRRDLKQRETKRTILLFLRYSRGVYLSFTLS